MITLTNEPARWGPWAGRIITGDENLHVIYAIDTNGVTKTFNLGIDPEDFDIIPTNQNLYACDHDLPNPLGGPSGAIVKFPASYFSNHVGDLLITDAGEVNPPAKLFIVHWDAVHTNFVTTSISYIRPSGAPGDFEHVTFAPVDIPYISQ